MGVNGEHWRTVGLAICVLGLAYITTHPRLWLNTPTEAVQGVDPPQRSLGELEDYRDIAGLEWGPLG